MSQKLGMFLHIFGLTGILWSVGSKSTFFWVPSRVRYLYLWAFWMKIPENLRILKFHRQVWTWRIYFYCSGTLVLLLKNKNARHLRYLKTKINKRDLGQYLHGFIARIRQTDTVFGSCRLVKKRKQTPVCVNCFVQPGVNQNTSSLTWQLGAFFFHFPIQKLDFRG